MLFLLLTTLGCRNKDLAIDTAGLVSVDDSTTVDSGRIDADGDGVAAAEDCDDTNPDISPLADEVCDEVDNDCDGEVDEDPVDGPSWYADEDGDGYGAGEGTIACEAPEGLVEYDGDCDDADSAWHPGAVEDDCTDPNDYNCDGSVGWEDGDGDGFAACEECDDGDASIHPDGEEVCDGADNNCDGQVDEDSAVDAGTWYQDADGDGFGDLDETTVACAAPEGFVEASTDCDDTDAEVNPDAAEFCDSIDNDCDGTIDEDDAVDASTWYADTDGDGYGDAKVSSAACEQPSGSVSDSTDCDDSASATYPGADEYCDGVDTDCDGTLDEDDALDALTWYGDGDGDGYGSGTGTASCSQPSSTASIDGDCDEGDSAINPGASEVCDGVDNDCDSSVDETGCPCNVKSYGGKSYLFCTSGQSWTNASATCASYGYHLLDVQNAAENSWADSTADTYSTGKWWIGLNDRASEGTWAWDGGAAVTYTNWHSGEPNNSGNEDCVQFNRFHPSQTWNDEGCGQALPYICEN